MLTNTTRFYDKDGKVIHEIEDCDLPKEEAIKLANKLGAVKVVDFATYHYQQWKPTETVVYSREPDSCPEE